MSDDRAPPALTDELVGELDEHLFRHWEFGSLIVSPCLRRCAVSGLELQLLPVGMHLVDYYCLGVCCKSFDWQFEQHIS